MLIHRTPPILVNHLSRSRKDTQWKFIKLLDCVKFKDAINLEPYMDDARCTSILEVVNKAMIIQLFFVYFYVYYMTTCLPYLEGYLQICYKIHFFWSSSRYTFPDLSMSYMIILEWSLPGCSNDVNHMFTFGFYVCFALSLPHWTKLKFGFPVYL